MNLPSVPPEAVMGNRRDDPNFDKLAQFNMHIARWRYVIMTILLALGLAGGRIIWPRDEFRALAQGQAVIRTEAGATRDSVRMLRARFDTAEIVSSVFRYGMARFACLKSTPEQQDVLPWSCNRLRDTGELIYNSGFQRAR